MEANSGLLGDSLYGYTATTRIAFAFLGQIHHLKVQTLLNLYNQHGEIGLQPVLKTHKTSLTIQKVYYMNSSKYCPVKSASGEKCRYAMSHKKFKVNSC